MATWLPRMMSAAEPPRAFSITADRAIQMLSVMELAEEAAPGARSMVLAVEYPLRSRVSLPALSTMVRIGLRLVEKL